jgi:two-component system alkaline phosphatase synthesis response regulator PhoP
VSRVKALLRRYKKDSDGKTGDNEFREFTIDREKYIVEKDGKVYNLPRKEFELLSLLVSKPNKVFTREEILSSIWGNDVVVGDRTIDVHVRKIREKLETPNIRTIKGVGYKYES